MLKTFPKQFSKWSARAFKCISEYVIAD